MNVKRKAAPPTHDLYALLQVHPRATQTVLKAAYHALVKENHPDKLGVEGHAKTKALNEAFATLSDTDLRRDYDEARRGPTDSLQIGDYRVKSLIAEGGFGKTYLGEQVIVGEPVCIKHCSEVSATHDAILIQEAKAIWDLRHYALPAMRGMYRLEDDSLALVMSYIEGPTLEQVVEKNGKVDAETVAWITERVLNALLYLHRHGVIHGDVKPQNLIVQPDRHQVVLVDFGLSMVKPTTSTKAIGYTPYFAPPEQMDGKPLLPASDFYSLGALMIYALSGTADAIAKMAVPSSVPDEMCAFIKRLLKRDILARPQDAGELFDELQKLRTKVFGRARSGMKPIPGF